MKLFLFLAISCLALHNGKGAPRTAVYKFVKCNPEGDQANCVTHKSPEMEWSPDLPSKLPASTAEDLEAEPEEGESPLREEEEEKEMDEDETLMSDKEESPVGEDGSGYEGSAAEDRFMEDSPFETGSGESWTEEPIKGRDTRGTSWPFPSRFLAGAAKPEEQELKEDHLLQLTN